MEGQRAGFGNKGWLRVWVPFECKELIWNLKNGRFIEVCGLARRSHPINAIGH